MQENKNTVEELQRLLKDESERCSLHKQNYQKIKDEYTKLQEQLTLIYEKLKEERLKHETTTSSNESKIRNLESTVKEQSQEINLKTEQIKRLDPKKIREAVLEEATTYYESKISELNSEIDKLRDQYNNLHYERNILQCRYEARESEFSRTMEKVKLEYFIEIDGLQTKIQNYEKEKQPESNFYAVELKTAKREILELNTKIKVLLSECDELRAQNENLTLQISGLMRSNSHQSADHTNNLRTLESEKLKAIRRLEVCEKELNNAQEHRKILKTELQSSKHEISILLSKLEDNERISRMTVAKMQDEMVQSKSDWESEQEELVEEITRLRTQLQDAIENFRQEHQMQLVKEQELKQEVINVRQQLWKSSNEFQQEKENLERKIRELSNENNNEQLIREIDSLNQKLLSCVASKVELEKELESFKLSAESASKTSVAHQRQQPISNCTSYEKEIQDLKEKFEQLAAICHGQHERKGESDCEFASKNTLVEKDQEILQLKLNWEQQKLQFQQRLEEIEFQLRECRNSFTAEKRELDFKIKQDTALISKLKGKLESQKEKLLSQRERLDQYIPAEVHLQVKNQLLELQRRLADYRKLIASDPGSVGKSAQMPPTKMLADIKNIDFRTFPHQGMGSKDVPQSEEINKNLKKKTAPSRRRFSKKKERNSNTKSVSSLLTSSSDYDIENL